VRVVIADDLKQHVFKHVFLLRNFFINKLFSANAKFKRLEEFQKNLILFTENRAILDKEYKKSLECYNMFRV